MLPEIIQPTNYLMRMPDGTVKQMNPFTGTEVWTVPGRGHRPLGNHADPGQKIDPARTDAHCAFCAGRLLEAPPEKARLIRAGDRWETLKNLPAEELFDTGVNCGMPLVKRFLQRTLNVLNVKGTKYPDLVVDGVIGPNTIATLKQALAVAPWYRLCLLRALDSLQCVRYIELAEGNEKFESFMPGWLRTRVGVRD